MQGLQQVGHSLGVIITSGVVVFSVVVVSVVAVKERNQKTFDISRQLQQTCGFRGGGIGWTRWRAAAVAWNPSNADLHALARARARSGIVDREFFSLHWLHVVALIHVPAIGAATESVHSHSWPEKLRLFYFGFSWRGICSADEADQNSDQKNYSVESNDLVFSLFLAALEYSLFIVLQGNELLTTDGGVRGFYTQCFHQDLPSDVSSLVSCQKFSYQRE